MKPTAIYWLLVVIVAGCRGVDPRFPPLLRELQGRGEGRDLDALLQRGTREAERLRRDFVVSVEGRTRAAAISDGVVAFRESVADALQGRPGIRRFALDAAELEQQIIGVQELSAEAAYGAFEGQWYGLWNDREVNHHWAEVVPLEPPLEVRMPAQPAVWLHAYQYAWVGDGYGVNLLASADLGGGRRRFLLGYVVHLRDRDLRQEVSRRPHVGVFCGPGQLVWITAREVFLEETLTLPGERPAYAITGFEYRLESGKLKSEKAFQAVYTRQPEDRPAWYGFAIDL